jgi:hypothetical protein
MPSQRQHRRFGNFHRSGERLTLIARRRKIDRLIRAERDGDEIGSSRKLWLTVLDLSAARSDVDGEQKAK